jgi:hypothetical protein
MKIHFLFMIVLQLLKLNASLSETTPFFSGHPLSCPACCADAIPPVQFDKPVKLSAVTPSLATGDDNASIFSCLARLGMTRHGISDFLRHGHLFPAIGADGRQDS